MKWSWNPSNLGHDLAQLSIFKLVMECSVLVWLHHQKSTHVKTSFTFSAFAAAHLKSAYQDNRCCNEGTLRNLHKASFVVTTSFSVENRGTILDFGSDDRWQNKCGTSGSSLWNEGTLAWSSQTTGVGRKKWLNKRCERWISTTLHWKTTICSMQEFLFTLTVSTEELDQDSRGWIEKSAAELENEFPALQEQNAKDLHSATEWIPVGSLSNMNAGVVYRWPGFISALLCWALLHTRQDDLS